MERIGRGKAIRESWGLEIAGRTRLGLGRDGQAAAVDGGEDGVSAASQESGAGGVPELFGIVSVAGIAEEFGAVGIGHDGFEVEANPSG